MLKIGNKKMILLCVIIYMVKVLCIMDCMGIITKNGFNLKKYL